MSPSLSVTYPLGIQKSHHSHPAWKEPWDCDQRPDPPADRRDPGRRGRDSTIRPLLAKIGKPLPSPQTARQEWLQLANCKYFAEQSGPNKRMAQQVTLEKKQIVDPTYGATGVHVFQVSRVPEIKYDRGQAGAPDDRTCEIEETDAIPDSEVQFAAMRSSSRWQAAEADYTRLEQAVGALAVDLARQAFATSTIAAIHSTRQDLNYLIQQYR